MQTRRHVALISLGCSKNLSDSEDLITNLRSLGFGLTDKLDSADLILINTCGFIADAKQESIDHILSAAEGRSNGAVLAVAGCLTQRYRDQLAEGLPEVDCWLDFDDYSRLPEVLAKHFPDLGPAHRLSLNERSQLTPPHHAFLKIAEGCDNDCNFCAIPLIRGRHISRPMDDLIEQARLYQQRGVLEINLISQHLDYYGYDLYGERRLPSLIRSIANAAPEAWIRLHYCYPNHFDDDLIAAMAETPNILPYIDMPIQHASDRILAVMGRRCKRSHIENRLQAIRQALPEVVLRSTFIVGHPCESDDDFEELLAFQREQGFDQVGCFAYSDEEDTISARMPDKVPEDTIAERHQRFMEQQASIHTQAAQRWLGQEIEVLVDEQLDWDRFACRHYGQASDVDGHTIIAGQELLVGTRIMARITAVEGYDLRAEAMSAAN